MKKQRLDVFLLEKGLVQSRSQAREAVNSGLVFVDGKPAGKAGTAVAPYSCVEIRGELCPFVSRGGLKLQKALDVFDIDVSGLVCLDSGASTGGFTDCLLQSGARRVYAVDVGSDQLAEKLREDARVVNLERTSLRSVGRELIPEDIEFASLDLSFISLALVLPAVRALTAESAQAVCLIKPQFEAGREKLGKRGVVKDANVHLWVLESFMKNARDSGFFVKDIDFSPVKGPEGNIEFLAHLSVPACGQPGSEVLKRVVSEAWETL